MSADSELWMNDGYMMANGNQWKSVNW